MGVIDVFKMRSSHAKVSAVDNSTAQSMTLRMAMYFMRSSPFISSVQFVCEQLILCNMTLHLLIFRNNQCGIPITNVLMSVFIMYI